MTTKLRLSTELALPLEAATRRLAILAMSGAGKSNVAVVMAEQMFDAGIPWVAIDPKGDWWGIRSSKDGKGPGLPVPIFGGLHGDIPLEPTAGKFIAETIIEQRLTCVLDISEFAERQQLWGFLIDFGETLLKKNRQALHLFLEEADEYLPQRTSEKGNLPKCLGVWQRVVKRGRFRGIGSTQITQRNASLNKDTLYQAEALIAMRVTGKADREAVKGWVEYHNAGAEIVQSLPTLADGEGWVSSPAWLRLTKRVQFERRRTFDSGQTPVLLKGNAPPATLADVDLVSLQTRMAATIERAKADDPRELRREIATLKKQLVAKPTAAPKAVAKPVVDQRAIDRAVAAAVMPYRKLISRVQQQMHGVVQAVKLLPDRLEAVVVTLGEVEQMNGHHPMKAEKSHEYPKVTPTPRAVTHRPASPPKPLGQSRGVDPDGAPIPKGQQKIIDALAELEAIGVDRPDRAQLGMFAGYNLTGGTGGQHIADLNALGLLELPDKGVVTLTDAGRAAAQPSDPPSTLDALHERMLAKLEDGQRRILEHLISLYPESISRADLGAAVNYNLTGGTGGQHVADLVTIGAAVLPRKGEVRASDILFPEALV